MAMEWSTNFKVTAESNHQLWPKLSFSALCLQFEFTDGFETMHKTRSSREEAPYSSIKLPGHMGSKINDLYPILSNNTRPVAAIKSLRFALLWFVSR